MKAPSNDPTTTYTPLNDYDQLVERVSSSAEDVLEDFRLRVHVLPRVWVGEEEHAAPDPHM